jgi:hypothetical protein
MVLASISSRNFCSMSNLVLSMIKWFAANYLVLSMDKMKYSTLHFGYKEKYIRETVNKLATTLIGKTILSK